MQKIEIMSELLANKIAAGEVVERIANVIKELVENSIDAKSKNIKIELVESGVKLIKVVDDGCGMSKIDAHSCFARHATSKIKCENDLFFINTLGFRGEALAAISSVSDIVLDTSDLQESTKIHIKAGVFKEESIGTIRQGTIIEVRDLFYNTPARLKFMKSLVTELSLSTNYLERIALSHPEISFELINDNKTIFKTTGINDLYKTIYEIFGYQVSKNMIQIKAENYDYIICGYVSNLNISKSNKSNMIILVNGRVVNNIEVNRTIKDAYHTVLAENKYPIVVINIETDPTLIDVNIHPTKQDIKFSKLDSLLELLFDTIKNSIISADNTFKGYNETISNNNNDEIPNKNYESLRLSFNISENENKYCEEKKEDTLIKPVGLALGTYLIAQDENIMYMMDIHAANERINYEKYMDELNKKKIYTTSMLFPLTIEYKKDEFMIIREHINDLNDLGFNICEFGDNTFRVTEHPSWIKDGYEEESIRKILDLMSSIKGKFDRVKFCEKAAIMLSCKMSVKANTSITYYEQEELINRLFKCKFPYTCPHGRPTIIKYPIYELEKLFKRVN